MGTDRRARRGLRALVVTIFTVTAVTTALIGAANAAPPTRGLRAQRGAQWLAQQIRHNGGYVKNSGVSDPSDTAYAVIGMRATGVDKFASDLAIRFLETKIGRQLQTGAHDAPGPIAYYVMAAIADGRDPQHFGGKAPINNLVNRLLATVRTTGADKGLFGAQDPSFDGAFRQGLALAALKGANVSPSDPRVKSAISWLTRQQCSNGLWESYRANTRTACSPSDPNTFTGPDTNSSALATQGLAAWGQLPHKSKLLQALANVQASDGGFPFVAAKHQASDPDSTALVIQALVAEGSGPASATWKKGSHSPYTALASYQLGCASRGFGAFFFPGSTSANVFATAQAVPAMAGDALPVKSSSASKLIPLKSC